MALTNLELEDKMKKTFLKNKFLGVFSKDELPECKEGHCMICNIQDSVNSNGQPLPGTHWIAAGRKGEPWCVDSFGLAPPKDVVASIGKYVAYNTRQVQDPKSDLCGYYAMAACCEIMASNHDPTETIREFIDQFDEAPLIKNDAILKNVLSKYKISMNK